MTRIGARGADAVLVKAISGSLGLAVVAEGVEDAQSADHLQALGCDVLQGYLFAEPLARGDFRIWLETNGRREPGAAGVG